MIFYLLYLVLVVQSWNHCYLPLFVVSLERILQVLSGDDRKSMSDDYFSVLATLILHRFDLALHAYDVISIKQIFVSIEKKKKKNGRENAWNFIFFFSRHVRYSLYFCLIPQSILH
jgi:hypothetical protein